MNTPASTPAVASVGRRTLVKGAAWAAPASAVAFAAPAFAVSQQCLSAEWVGEAYIRFADPYYSTRNFTRSVWIDRGSPVPGDFEMQHYVTPADAGYPTAPWWRLVIGMPWGAAPGMTIRIPVGGPQHPMGDDDWAGWSIAQDVKVQQLGYAGPESFARYTPRPYTNTDAGTTTLYTTDLPPASVSTTSEAITITFNQAVPEYAAGAFRFRAVPEGGVHAFDPERKYWGIATATFSPLQCTEWPPVTNP